MKLNIKHIILIIAIVASIVLIVYLKNSLLVFLPLIINKARMFFKNEKEILKEIENGKNEQILIIDKIESIQNEINEDKKEMSEIDKRVKLMSNEELLEMVRNMK